MIARATVINRPRPLRIDTDMDGSPAAVHLTGRCYAVAALLDVWRIDDEWWREEPVSRTYYEIELEEGRIVTVFRDEIEGSWWEQRYG